MAEDDKRFSHLVEGLVTKAQIETKCDNSDTLRDVIKVHIKSWLDNIENINPLFKISELIPVGSYAEGTKILQPDEFDYLAIIEEFSKPGMIRIDADESDIKEGVVKVKVVDEELNLKCNEVCKDGYLQCIQPVNFPKREEKRFGHVFIKSISMIVKYSKRIGLIYLSPTDLDCIVPLPKVNNAPLYFKGAHFKAPNVLIEFVYKGKELTVDISPAIRYHNINDCFREKDCAGPAFAELVLGRQSLLLVGTPSEFDLKVTVTEAEVEYIKTVMKFEHKIIYIFLKYVVNHFNVRGGLPFPFTSYMMKTVCIHHDIRCVKSEGSIKECFKSVIDDLYVSAQKKFVVSIVNQNIQFGDRYFHYETFQRECLLQGMRTMSQLPKEIDTVEAFDKFLKEIIENEWQKRSEALEESFKTIEVDASFVAERKEMISKIVDMGFEHEEVLEILSETMFDSEHTIRILQDLRAKALEEQKDNNGSCSSGHKITISSGETDLGSEKCFSWRTSKHTGNSSRDNDIYSGKILLALPEAPKAITYEILYQRQKGV